MDQATSSQENTSKMSFHIIVRMWDGRELPIYLGEEQFKTITVLQLKETLREPSGVIPDQSRLIFQGRELLNNCLLCEYGIQNMSTVDMTIRLRGGGTPIGGGGMGDKDKNQSMERLANFKSV